MIQTITIYARTPPNSAGHTTATVSIAFDAAALERNKDDVCELIAARLSHAFADLYKLSPQAKVIKIVGGKLDAK